MADKTREYLVIVKGLKVKCRILEITSEGICTIIIADSNCCHEKHINELEKI